MKKCLAAVALSIASVAPANAAVFDFSYTLFGGTVATGTVTATDLGGFYSVDDVTGARGGVAITDYDFFDLTPQSFTYNGGQATDVDFSYYIGAENYEIRWPGSGGGSFGTEFRTDAAGAVTSLLVTNFTLTPKATAAVPEPASWALMLVGFGAVGAALRSRRQAGKLLTA